jgi:hypothetical protein
MAQSTFMENEIAERISLMSPEEVREYLNIVREANNNFLDNFFAMLIAGHDKDDQKFIDAFDKLGHCVVEFQLVIIDYWAKQDFTPLTSDRK